MTYGSILHRYTVSSSRGNNSSKYSISYYISNVSDGKLDLQTLNNFTAVYFTVYGNNFTYTYYNSTQWNSGALWSTSYRYISSSLTPNYGNTVPNFYAKTGDFSNFSNCKVTYASNFNGTLVRYLEVTFTTSGNIQTTGTTYLTCSSTSGTSYLTRSSISGYSGVSSSSSSNSGWY